MSAPPFRPTVRGGKALVVHAGTRETRWIEGQTGKSGPDGRPKGYRCFFAPGDGREFDSEGRPWHDEKAALRLWSMVPKGMAPEKRAELERARLGLVADIDAARAAVEADRKRADEEVPVANAKGEVKMKKRTRSLGLPKEPKGAAQAKLFDVAPCPVTVERKRVRRAEAKRARERSVFQRLESK
jgi:hypothetical protein